MNVYQIVVSGSASRLPTEQEVLDQNLEPGTEIVFRIQETFTVEATGGFQAVAAHLQDSVGSPDITIQDLRLDLLNGGELVQPL